MRSHQSRCERLVAKHSLAVGVVALRVLCGVLSRFASGFVWFGRGGVVNLAPFSRVTAPIQGFDARGI